MEGAPDFIYTALQIGAVNELEDVIYKTCTGEPKSLFGRRVLIYREEDIIYGTGTGEPKSLFERRVLYRANGSHTSAAK